jgi:tetratricopeptide (TPR) repeat protein
MGSSRNYLSEISRRDARQMFTAGGADQQVADNGPNGHSVFTWTLLQGLDGRADMNGDGVITASELAAYVTPAVSALSQQTPAFGNLPGSTGGDFIFDLRHDTEFLNADSAQLNADAIRLNDEIAKLRAQNDRLQRELAAARSRTQVASATRSATAPHSAAAMNDEGMRLYKERNYAEALNRFTEAVKLDPNSALFANNLAFTLFKVQQYEQSIPWFETAIKLDPQRAIAYLNLADVQLQLNRKKEAKENYEKYLQLAPNSKSVPYVREKLASVQDEKSVQ